MPDRGPLQPELAIDPQEDPPDVGPQAAEPLHRVEHVSDRTLASLGGARPEDPGVELQAVEERDRRQLDGGARAVDGQAPDHRWWPRTPPAEPWSTPEETR